jgi:hypothetical protein
MSPKSFARKNGKKQARMEMDVVISLNDAAQRMRKEVDAPLYLLRSDDW